MVKITDAGLIATWLESDPESRDMGEVTLDRLREFLHIYYGTLIAELQAEPFFDGRWTAEDRIRVYDFDHKWEHVRGTDSVERCTVCHLMIGK